MYVPPTTKAECIIIFYVVRREYKNFGSWYNGMSWYNGFYN